MRTHIYFLCRFDGEQIIIISFVFYDDILVSTQSDTLSKKHYDRYSLISIVRFIIGQGLL
jgi:hypothetical protein